MSTVMSGANSSKLSNNTASQNRSVKHKRRFCRHEGCTRIVKSQGLCQRHGAKPRKCKEEGCEKQAQGNFDGMCKSHFKAHKRATTAHAMPTLDTSSVLVPPPPEGDSVYDRVIPASVAWNPNHASEGELMPLIQHLKDGFDQDKPPAWHRNEERRARGLFPVTNPATQLEGWERELVWAEILTLTGSPGASFRHLARGWGRDKGFHMVLAQFICERRGDVERKKRQKGAKRTKEDQALPIGADIYDIACYGDAAYNEELAADLLTFTSPADYAAAEKRLAEGGFEFEEEEEDSTSPVSSGESDYDRNSNKEGDQDNGDEADPFSEQPEGIHSTSSEEPTFLTKNRYTAV